MTLSGQQTYAMYVLLFHLPSVLINDAVSPTVAAVVAAPTIKLCEAVDDEHYACSLGSSELPQTGE